MRILGHCVLLKLEDVVRRSEWRAGRQVGSRVEARRGRVGRLVDLGEDISEGGGRLKVSRSGERLGAGRVLGGLKPAK